MATIDAFRAQLSGGGARASQFKVELSFPTWVGGTNAATSAVFLVKAASLPASTIQPIDTPFRGRIAKLPGERVFNNWQVTVLNDNDFLIRNALEVWSAGVLNHTSTRGRIKPSEYITNMFVTQLDRNDNAIKQYKFYNCFPQVVGEIQLDFGNINTIEEFPVEFSIDYFESITNAASITP